MPPEIEIYDIWMGLGSTWRQVPAVKSGQASGADQYELSYLNLLDGLLREFTRPNLVDGY